MEDQKPFDVRAKLAAELGRTPPDQPKEDYAPKQSEAQGVGESELAQNIKNEMRAFKGWHGLTFEEREALDLIATEISRICAGRNQWHDLSLWVTLGLEGNAR